MKTKFEGKIFSALSPVSNENRAVFALSLFKVFLLGCLVTSASPAWSLTTSQRITLLEQAVTALQNQVTTLETSNGTLTTQVNNQNSQIASLTATNNTLSNLVGVLETDIAATKSQAAVLQSDLNIVKNNSVLALDKLLFLNKGNVVFTGVNVQIVNGLGQTNTTNGVGNLILGYNEFSKVNNTTCTFHNDKTCVDSSGTYFRFGSHNIISGMYHTYNSYGGAVFGYANALNAPWSTVTGGAFNISDGIASTVTGGASNQAYGENSSVLAGYANKANGIQSSVTGGSSNIAQGRVSSVSGGDHRSTLNMYEWAAGSFLEKY